MPPSRPAARAGRASSSRADTAPHRSQRGTPRVVRWVDLLAVLLRSSASVPRDTILRHVPDYARQLAPDGTPPDALLRKFERDKDELKAFGIPLETTRDDATGSEHYRLRRTDFYLPYLALQQEGAPPPRKVSRALYHGLRTEPVAPDAIAIVRAAALRARAVGDPVLAEQVDGALRKLAVDLRDVAVAPDDAVALPPRRALDAAVVSTLASALAERRHVRFTYHSIGRDATEARTVAPYALVPLQGQWYLVGHDATRGAGAAGIRMFRVSRIRDAAFDRRGAAPEFAIPADFDRAAWAAPRPVWALGDAPPVPVTFEVVRATGAALEALDEGEPVDGAPMRRTVAVRRPDAFVRWALQFGGAVRPVAPAAIVGEWRAALRTMRAQYAEVGA